MLHNIKRPIIFYLLIHQLQNRAEQLSKHCKNVMKTISANQRTINIINRAIENGFEFSESDSIEEVRIEAEGFLIDNTEAIEEECEVKYSGRSQRVDWSDGLGFDFWSQGEIVDFSSNWHKSPETKVFYETLVDSEGKVVKLYYLVGETDYNAPEGFFYNRKLGKHIAFENEG